MHRNQVQKSCDLQNLLAIKYFNDQIILVKSQILVIPLRCVDTSLLFFTADDYSCGMKSKTSSLHVQICHSLGQIKCFDETQAEFSADIQPGYVERGDLHTFNQ